LPDFSTRILRPELLDGGQLPDEEARKSLLDLRRVNRRLGARKMVLESLAREVSRHGLSEYSLLDIASGSGDLPLAVIEWARKHGLSARVFALEYQHRHLSLFRRELLASSRIHPLCADAFHAPLPDGKFDFVTCCHFLHHLTEEDAARLLASMARLARRSVIVSDLERQALPYYFFLLFGRLITRSYVSRIDGRNSIAQSFRKPELESIAHAAGLSEYKVERRWPFHLLLVGNAQTDSSR
jgi:ubiquinone/menaquinone biosynthesis C-methylase UbiE